MKCVSITLLKTAEIAEQQKDGAVYGRKTKVEKWQAADNSTCHIAQNQDAVGVRCFVAEIPYK